MPVTNETYKILLQSNPGNTETLVYTSPSEGLGTVVSVINVCNTGTANDTFTIEIVPNSGSSGQTKQYLLYNNVLAPNVSTTVGQGLTLAPGDMIYASAGTTNTAFGGFGTELS